MFCLKSLEKEKVIAKSLRLVSWIVDRHLLDLRLIKAMQNTALVATTAILLSWARLYE